MMKGQSGLSNYSGLYTSGTPGNGQRCLRSHYLVGFLLWPGKI